MERKRKLDVYQTASKDRPDGSSIGAEQNGGTLNPYTGRPYSERYFEILRGRQGKCQFTRKRLS